MRKPRTFCTRREGRARVDAGWLLVVAALVGALAMYGVWASLSRRRLRARVAELEKALESRVTELESARLQLQRLSTEDPLTAVANHEQFLEFLEREWRRARRDGLPLSLIFVDVDHFRAYNRQFGRKSGDDVLKQVGRALAGVVGRPGDLVARYHRDEFAIVLASTDGPGAYNISEQIRQAIQDMQMPAAKDASLGDGDGVGGDGHRDSATRIGLGGARLDQGGTARAARSPRRRRQLRAAREPGHGRAARAGRPPLGDGPTAPTRMRLELTQCTVRPWLETDVDALARHANNRNVSIHLRDRFPFPYEIDHAQKFLDWLAARRTSRRCGRSKWTARPPAASASSRKPTSSGSRLRSATGSASRAGTAAS